MRCPCIGPPKTKGPAPDADRPSAQEAPPTAAETSRNPGGDALSDAQPVRHRLISQTFVSNFRHPSMSLKTKHNKVRGAGDASGKTDPSTPTEEQVRRFYALYGHQMEPHGRNTTRLQPVLDGPEAEES